MANLKAAFEKYPNLLRVDIHFSGHALPHEDKYKAGELGLCEGHVHCWELLKLISDTCPTVDEVEFYLDCCGAAGAFWQAT